MSSSSLESHCIAVIGAGSWGTALGAWLANNGHSVRIWDVDQTVIEDINHHHRNSKYFQDFELPNGLQGCNTLESAIESCSAVVVAVPSRVFNLAISSVSDHLHLMDSGTKPIVIWGTKGFDSDTGDLLSEVTDRILKGRTTTATIAGPSFAYEVIRGLPTGFHLASTNAEDIESIANMFRNTTSLVYTTDDIVGVQVGGATKNVIAIAAGISDGLGFGINTRALLITRGFAEMNRLNIALGGRTETLTGLSGMGDLFLTCSGDLSRNRRLGLGLGSGKQLDSVLEEIGQEVEGLQSARETYHVGKKLDVFMPMTERVYRILYEQLPPMQAAMELLAIGPSIPDRNR